MLVLNRATWVATRVAVTAGLGLLASGCVYNPYTGLYEPCCAYAPYGYPPGPAYAPPPAGAPAGAVPEEQPGQVEPGPPPSYPQRSSQAGGHPKVAERFQQANVTGDGRLTLQQAQTAGWKAVARNFETIDAEHKGYVTLADVQAWLASRRAAHAEAPPPA